jgi:non-ribosomal peptide synthase protein (TIGR01720 family)
MANPDSPRRPGALNQLTAEQRELLALRLRKAQQHVRAGRPAAEPAPLSFTQEQLWFLDRLEPGTPVYNVPFALRLEGPLDPAALKRAVDAVVARHDALRTVFAEGDDGLRQIVRPEVRIELPLEDLRALVDADRDEATVRASVAHAAWSFDLTTGPLLAVKLLAIADDEHLLLVTAHHIVFDAWSAGVFTAELVALYGQHATGESAQLPALTTSFTDHVLRTRSAAGLEAVEQSLAHWRERLADAPPVSTLPPDHPRPPVQTHRGGRLPLELPATLTAQLAELARSTGATMNSVMLAGVAAMLRRATGQDDVVIGMPAASRPRTDLEPLIGCFANMLVLRIDLSGDPTVRELVARTHSTVRDAYAHQQAPFARVVEEVAPPRDPSINPLFQVMVTIAGDDEDDRAAAGVRFTQVAADNGLTDFDVFITLTRRAGAIEGILDYNADLYLEESVDGSAGRLPEVLAEMVDQPDARLQSVCSLRRGSVAVAATFTSDLVRAPLGHWLSVLGMPAAIASVPYGQMIPHLLAGDPDVASICLLRWEDWLRHRDGGERPAEAERVLADAMSDLEAGVRAFRERTTAPLILVVCPPSPRFQEAPWARALARLDDRLALLRSRVAGVHALWAADDDVRHHVADAYDARADELGHVPYSTEYSAALATMAARELHRAGGRCARVVLVDERIEWREALARERAHLRVVACSDPLAELREHAGVQPVALLAGDAALVAAARAAHPSVIALAVPERWEDARGLLDHVWVLDRPDDEPDEPLVTLGSERSALIAEHLATPAAVVERVAAAAPRSHATDAVVAPRTATEERLASLWRDALRLDEVGVTADFFMLGGHSLLATQLLSRIQVELGAEISLYTLFTHPTIEQLAAVLDGAQACAGEQVRPAPAGAELVASSSQERLWALAQLDEDVVRHNTSFAMTLRGALDLDALERATAELVRCHEALRTTFRERNGRPVPAIHEQLDCWVAPADVSALDDRKRKRAVRRLVDEHAGFAYDLATGPLLRVRAVRTSPDEHVLLVGMHHIICDNTSWNIVLDDLVAAYDARVAGEPSPLQAPPVGFTDFARHQRAWLESDDVDRHVAYWREKLRDTPVLDLPTDHPRPATRSDIAGNHACRLPAGLGATVREVARAEGVSPFTVLATAFALLLREQSGQSDLVLGVPTAGREGHELDRVVGCFTDLLAFRIDLGGRPTFRQLLRRTHTTALDAYNHQRLPFANVVEALRLPRDPSRHPLFSCVFNVLDLPDELPRFGGLEAAHVDVGNPGVDFDLFMTLRWQDDELHADLTYSAELFTPDRARTLVTGFSRVLAAALEQPDACIDEARSAQPAAQCAKVAAAPAATVAIAASHPACEVVDTVRFWSDLLAPGLEVGTAPAGQVLRPLLDAGSPLGGTSDDLNVVLLRWEDWLADEPAPTPATVVPAVSRLERALADVREAIAGFRARSDARLAVLVAPPSPTRAGTLWDGAATRATQRLTRACARHVGVEVFALEQWAARYGVAGDADPSRMQAVAGTLVARLACRHRRQDVATVLADPERLHAPAALAEIARATRRNGRELVLTSEPATPELRALLGAGALRVAVSPGDDLDAASSVVLCPDEEQASAARPGALAVVAGTGDEAVRGCASRLWLLDPPPADRPATTPLRMRADLLLDTASELRDADAIRTAVKSGFRRAAPPPKTAPRDDRERALAAIWAQLLRLDEVGVHDDFFEIGGDSLLAMRIVISAAEAGIAITPRQLVRHPTIAELAAVAGEVEGDAPASDAEQGVVTGDMPVTPAQAWFFDALAPSMKRPAHFNHPYYLELGRPVAVELLERAVDALARHHDALRLRFDRRDGTWTQRYAAPAGAVPFESHDLTTLDEAERERAVEELASSAQLRLDLTGGPTVRALHVRLGAGRADRLLIVAHHLVTDAVSRGILLDDLQTLLHAFERGATPALPAKSTSYRTWAQRLGDAATSGATRSELDYWLEQVDYGAGVVAPDRPGAGTSLATLATLEAELDADETAGLHDVARTLKVGIRDLLVWAVARSVVECADSTECTIATTGHGREDLLEELDVSRTVGWFQVLYPIRLRLAERRHDPGSVAEVARQLAAVPRNGIGYGLLRYAADEDTRRRLAAVTAPRIAVNYMGTFGFEEVAGADELLTVCQAPYGATEDGTCAWPYDLDVMGSIAAGKLRIELSYGGDLYRAERMTALLDDVRARLSDLTRDLCAARRDERDVA